MIEGVLQRVMCVTKSNVCDRGCDGVLTKVHVSDTEYFIYCEGV